MFFENTGTNTLYNQISKKKEHLKNGIKPVLLLPEYFIRPLTSKKEIKRPS